MPLASMDRENSTNRVNSAPHTMQPRLNWVLLLRKKKYMLAKMGIKSVKQR